jgi:hypothetical protein
MYGNPIVKTKKNSLIMSQSKGKWLYCSASQQKPPICSDSKIPFVFVLATPQAPTGPVPCGAMP